ncbi:hypothetical protein CFIMG_003497RA [Ceratocystis fimbriata CBS 114723]|uniref:Uncharacterized protein n=1 Tax=Ceratocystis fimbriata CBS 114723 TaxID=1035309 RepID=A0A2C5X144_9PEZI|nr:hypothetical protein CFIMG_003497RA [Ceratocystis fimbriata CBS 114723]
MQQGEWHCFSIHKFTCNGIGKGSQGPLRFPGSGNVNLDDSNLDWLTSCGGEGLNMDLGIQF